MFAYAINVPELWAVSCWGSAPVCVRGSHRECDAKSGPIIREIICAVDGGTRSELNADEIDADPVAAIRFVSIFKVAWRATVHAEGIVRTAL